VGWLPGGGLGSGGLGAATRKDGLEPPGAHVYGLTACPAPWPRQTTHKMHFWLPWSAAPRGVGARPSSPSSLLSPRCARWPRPHAPRPAAGCVQLHRGLPLGAIRPTAAGGGQGRRKPARRHPGMGERRPPPPSRPEAVTHASRDRGTAARHYGSCPLTARMRPLPCQRLGSQPHGPSCPQPACCAPYNPAGTPKPNPLHPSPAHLDSGRPAAGHAVWRGDAAGACLRTALVVAGGGLHTGGL
jgi:hypothetical protein